MVEGLYCTGRYWDIQSETDKKCPLYVTIVYAEQWRCFLHNEREDEGEVFSYVEEDSGTKQLLLNALANRRLRSDQLDVIIGRLIAAVCYFTSHPKYLIQSHELFAAHLSQVTVSIYHMVPFHSQTFRIYTTSRNSALVSTVTPGN